MTPNNPTALLVATVVAATPLVSASDDVPSTVTVRTNYYGLPQVFVWSSPTEPNWDGDAFATGYVSTIIDVTDAVPAAPSKFDLPACFDGGSLVETMMAGSLRKRLQNKPSSLPFVLTAKQGLTASGTYPGLGPTTTAGGSWSVSPDGLTDADQNARETANRECLRRYIFKNHGTVRSASLHIRATGELTVNDSTLGPTPMTMSKAFRFRYDNPAFVSIEAPSVLKIDGYAGRTTTAELTVSGKTNIGTVIVKVDATATDGNLTKIHLGTVGSSVGAWRPSAVSGSWSQTINVLATATAAGQDDTGRITITVETP